MAAAQQDADAYNVLGICFETGRGVSQDLRQALTMYKKAKEYGHTGVDAAISRVEAAQKSKKHWWNI